MVGPGQGLVGARGQLECVLSSVQWGARAGASGPLPLWGDADWRGKGKDVGTRGTFVVRTDGGSRLQGRQWGGQWVGPVPAGELMWADGRRVKSVGTVALFLHVLRTDLGDALRKARRGLSGGGCVSGEFLPETGVVACVLGGDRHGMWPTVGTEQSLWAFWWVLHPSAGEAKNAARK